MVFKGLETLGRIKYRTFLKTFYSCLRRKCLFLTELRFLYLKLNLM
jgi:hypothetical protein